MGLKWFDVWFATHGSAMFSLQMDVGQSPIFEGLGHGIQFNLEVGSAGGLTHSQNIVAGNAKSWQSQLFSKGTQGRNGSVCHELEGTAYLRARNREELDCRPGFDGPRRSNACPRDPARCHLK